MASNTDEPPSEEIELQPVGTEGPPSRKSSFFSRGLGIVTNLIGSINHNVNTSRFGRVFRLQGSGHPDAIIDANFTTEVRAGLTTFATMAYIIAVNAAILADTGFDCYCGQPLDPMGNCTNKDEWEACYNELKLDLITATAAISGLSSILFGITTNLPVALAPGMGLNAYFTYQVVGTKGSGKTPYRLALMAVFLEGWIFVFLALTGLRHWLVKVIPPSIKIASGVGIGLFLTLIGMSYSSGIGIVTGASSTPLAIGGCPAEDLDVAGECEQNVMTNPKMWIGIMFGGILTSVLMAFRVKAAIVIGIAFVSILSWPRNTPMTYFPHTPEGTMRWNYFKQVIAFHPLKHTLAQQQWDLSEYDRKFAIALFTFLYVDIIDCTATLYSMARFCNRVPKGKKDFPRSTIAYCTDAVCISIGALFGTSPVTVFIESGAGVAEGGRTGVTAITTGICFLGCLFFAPIFASIPPWATGSTLILVGCLMIRQVTRVNWRYIGDAIPAFVTLSFIPFTYSVAYGLIAGLFTYASLNLMIWLVIKLSRGTIIPKDYEQKEYWTWKPGGEKPWIIRIFIRFCRFWINRRSPSRNTEFSLPSGADGAPSVRMQPSAPSREKLSERTSSPSRLSGTE